MLVSAIKDMISNLVSIAFVQILIIMKIGYARVSTKHQCDLLDQQIFLLKEEGCKEIYSEVVSGSKLNSKELNLVLQKLKANDALVITAIDRLGGNLKDLISAITNLQKCNIIFKSLKEKIDTSTDTGILMIDLIRSVETFKRKSKSRRIRDGVLRAKKEKKYKGRLHILDQESRKKYVDMLATGKYTVSYICRIANISRQTLYNWKDSFALAK